MVGALLISSGFFASAYVQNMQTLYLTHGVLCGECHSALNESMK